jgi:hypothetical protein
LSWIEAAGRPPTITWSDMIRIRRQSAARCLRRCMAGLVPVPIARIFEALRMRRVAEEIRVQVNNLVTERRGLAAKCLAHQIEIVPISLAARTG